MAGSPRLRMAFLLVVYWPQVEEMKTLTEVNRWLHDIAPTVVPDPQNKETIEKRARKVLNKRQSA